MEREEFLSCILDSYPYRIAIADKDHNICYFNKKAEEFYYGKRGHKDLIGKPLFNYVKESTKQKILAAVEVMKETGEEVFITVNSDDLRQYLCPVFDKGGEFIGYYSRFEKNLHL